MMSRVLLTSSNSNSSNTSTTRCSIRTQEGAEERLDRSEALLETNRSHREAIPNRVKTASKRAFSSRRRRPPTTPHRLQSQRWRRNQLTIRHHHRNNRLHHLSRNNVFRLVNTRLREVAAMTSISSSSRRSTTIGWRMLATTITKRPLPSSIVLSPLCPTRPSLIYPFVPMLL